MKNRLHFCTIIAGIGCVFISNGSPAWSKTRLTTRPDTLARRQTGSRYPGLPPSDDRWIQPLREASRGETRAAQWEPTQLIIPAIRVEAPVVPGVDNKALRDGAGHDPASDLPGQPGHCVIAAHRNVWGAWFWHLPRLKPGSLIELRTPRKRYTYRVVFSRTVPPHETSVLERPPHNEAAPRLTLYTCTIPKSASRFIIVANMVQTEDAPTEDKLARESVAKITKRDGFAPFTGKCVNVLDGDIISVMRYGREEKVRLTGIDCPESGQPFGDQARQFTRSSILDQIVTVYPTGYDGRGSIMGWVFTGPRCVNAQLIASGHAWWQRQKSPNEARLARLENEARQRQMGLWSNPRATPPWEWRRAR